MKNQNVKKYLYQGLLGVLVAVAVVVVVFAFIKINVIRALLGKLFDILMPITIGAVLAYLLSPLYNRVVKKCYPYFTRWLHSKKRGMGCAKAAATILCIGTTIVVVTGLVAIMIPQLITSIEGIVATFSTNAENLSLWIQKTLADNPDLETLVLGYYNTILNSIEEWMNNDGIKNFLTTNVMPNVQTVLAGVSTSVVYILDFLKNILVGLVAAIYLLNMKQTLAGQAKKILYSIFKVEHANWILNEARFIDKMFSGFIIGKLLDSLIIGILCFIGMQFMKMPYPLLVSVIIGVTNIIPFFGPFIGAIPTAFLIILVSPVKCLYFLLFILLLQQFDGNILGPKILGEYTGISSFWVLFSILLFGGLFGFVGMIIAVPTFAVIYDLVNQWSLAQLKEKELSTSTADYMELDYIDEENRRFIKK